MSTALRDNRPSRGSTGDFLKTKIAPDSKLSFVSAYFTVSAYAGLQAQLESAEKLRFLFGEPSFISQVDSNMKGEANFKLTDTGLQLGKVLTRRADLQDLLQTLPRLLEGLPPLLGLELLLRRAVGQRQRVALARVILKDAPILILDEATSALDPETEKAICTTIEQLRGTLTILAISHQSGLIDAADRVYRLENKEATLIIDRSNQHNE